MRKEIHLLRDEIENIKGEIIKANEETKTIANLSSEEERNKMELQDEIKKINGLLSVLGREREKILKELQLYSRKREMIITKIDLIEKNTIELMSSVGALAQESLKEL